MNKILLLLGLAIGLLSGCQTLYVPNVVNAPLMSEPGETQIGMAVGSNGYNLNLAFSPAPYVALMANGNLFNYRKGIEQDSLYRQQFIEAGLGFYSRLSKYWRFETFVGYGGGLQGDEIETAYYRRWFIQPDIGVSGRIVDAAFSPRITFVNHNRSVFSLREFEQENKGVFLEPTVTLRAGYEQFKFQFQTGPTLPLGDNLYGRYHKWNVSFGFHLTFVKNFERYMK